MKNRRGIQDPHVPQIWCNSDQYSRSYGILKKIGVRHFSMIGRHHESVSRTEPVFELNLAPSEERPTYEFRMEIFDPDGNLFSQLNNLCVYSGIEELLGKLTENSFNFVEINARNLQKNLST